MQESAGRQLATNTARSMKTVSIMKSKRQISDIEMAIDNYGQEKTGSMLGMRNRQISSGVILDWKQFQESEQVKSQLLMKDGENDEKTIFSYVVQEWFKQEPAKVIYRWMRKCPKNQQNSGAAQLIEEEHIYRGPMKHYRKHGQGMYIIVKKYSDNSEKIRSIKGEWHQDILRTGLLTDQNGNEEILSSNVLRLSTKSKKEITPYLEKNQAIEDIKKKSMHMIPSGKQIPPPRSGHSIREKHNV